jgi:hypothetical protein
MLLHCHTMDVDLQKEEEYNFNQPTWAMVIEG